MKLRPLSFVALGILLFAQCTGSNKNPETSSGPTNQVFHSQLLVLCNLVQNYNDLLVKKPGPEAWVSYSDLLKLRSDELKSCCLQNESESKGFLAELVSYTQLSNEMPSASLEENHVIQKALYQKIKKWMSSYKL